MIVLVAFAFLAGIVTILLPCILPILPIVLSSTIGGRETGKSRPFGVIIGFILSFTFFTLFLSTIVSFSGIPADSLRLFSVFVIGLFGISFFVPQVQLFLEKLFATVARFVPQGNTKTGLWSGIVIGLSIGLLWTPCVGPILASVISLAITGTVTLDAFLIAFAYALGTALPMFAIMIGGRSLLLKVPGLLAHTATIQKGFGIVMILTALAIFHNYDRKFQTFILNSFPQYGVGLTQFEDNATVRNSLEKLGGIQEAERGKPMFDLQPKGTKAPEIIPGGVWFNSPPLMLEQVRGKVVLIDFWTYSCINCQRTFPYLRQWHEKYKDKGLVIIGVHSPEFAFEKSEKNVRDALSDFDLRYPVVQDNNFATWRAYNNHYWPAKYLIDKEGYIRYSHFGEGAYDETENLIQELLQETGRSDVSLSTENPTYTNYAGTPETYLGYLRIDRFASGEQIVHDAFSVYSAPQTLLPNQIAFTGTWKITGEYAQPQKGATLLLNFEAKKVFLVMRKTADTPARVRVLIDDKENDIITVDSDRLYQLLELSSPGRHILRLEFEDNNAELYAFTFG